MNTVALGMIFIEHFVPPNLCLDLRRIPRRHLGRR